MNMLESFILYSLQETNLALREEINSYQGGVFYYSDSMVSVSMRKVFFLVTVTLLAVASG